MLPSQLPDTTVWPSGEKATLRTLLVCPLSVRISSPLLASQTFSVSSLLPETIRWPSGEKATLVTDVVCPLQRW